jgi:two-component system, OmpR family, response regulator
LAFLISILVRTRGEDEAATELLRAGDSRTFCVGLRIADQQVVDLVTAVLRFEGFVVVPAAIPREATEESLERRGDSPDVIVAELSIGADGSLLVPDAITSIRGHAALLYLKPRDRMHERVHGLTIGAGSFLEMPFSVSEFVARVRTVLRHAGSSSSHQLISYADLVLDEDEMYVRRGSRTVELTRTEFGLLRYLVANAPRVLSKVQILEHVWPYDFKGDTTVVETYVSYLRRKVDVGGPPLIHTVRGIGYTLRMPY